MHPNQSQPNIRTVDLFHGETFVEISPASTKELRSTIAFFCWLISYGITLCPLEQTWHSFLKGRRLRPKRNFSTGDAGQRQCSSWANRGSATWKRSGEIPSARRATPEFILKITNNFQQNRRQKAPVMLLREVAHRCSSRILIKPRLCTKQSTVSHFVELPIVGYSAPWPCKSHITWANNQYGSTSIHIWLSVSSIPFPPDPRRHRRPATESKAAARQVTATLLGLIAE